MKQKPEIFETMLPAGTIRYLKENEDAFSLPREGFTTVTKALDLRRETITRILSDRIADVTLGGLRYLYAIFREYEQLGKLTALKSSKKGKWALVLGNGPSLGYLNPVWLRDFQGKGGEVLSVNYWNSTHLREVAPDYLVISDGGILTIAESSLSKKQSEKVKTRNDMLEEYLRSNGRILLLCPLNRVKEMERRFGTERITGFVDHAMQSISSNIDPRFPRGYGSMTLFKSLAIAIHMGYDKILLLGMDNTYPRDVYCDNKNKIYRLERHANSDDTIFDLSALVPSMAVLVQGMLDIFSDLHRCFKGYPIVNLDPYSLTDVFRKVESLDSLEIVLGSGATPSVEAR